MPLIPKYYISVGRYREYVFEIGELENAVGMNFSFNGSTADEIITGPWEFTFPITALAETAEFSIELPRSEFFSRADIEISPMATRITFYELPSNPSSSDPGFHHLLNDYFFFSDYFVTLVDGTEINLYIDTIYTDSGARDRRTTFYFVSEYIDISRICSVTMFGVVHRLRR